MTPPCVLCGLSGEPGSGESTLSLFFLASLSPKVEISPVKSDMNIAFSGQAWNGGLKSLP
jgi:hypothetical protein